MMRTLLEMNDFGPLRIRDDPSRCAQPTRYYYALQLWSLWLTVTETVGQSGPYNDSVTGPSEIAQSIHSSRNPHWNPDLACPDVPSESGSWTSTCRSCGARVAFYFKDWVVINQQGFQVSVGLLTCRPVHWQPSFSDAVRTAGFALDGLADQSGSRCIQLLWKTRAQYRTASLRPV